MAAQRWGLMTVLRVADSERTSRCGEDDLVGHNKVAIPREPSQMISLEDLTLRHIDAKIKVQERQSIVFVTTLLVCKLLNLYSILGFDFAIMNHAFFHQRQPAFRRLLDRYAIDEEKVDMIRDIVFFGSMCGTAIASPMLFELRNIWFMDIFIFFFSSTAFMLQNLEEIKTYGPFTLVAATFLGLAAYSSARTPLKELIPWLPTSVCLFILLTVYFFPQLRQSLSGNNGTQLAMEEAMEEGHAYGFHSTPVEPGSVQSDEDINNQPEYPEVHRWLEYDTSYMEGIDRPASRQSRGPSTRESDIDLDSVARMVVQRTMSPSRSVHNRHVPRTTSNGSFPSQKPGIAGLSSHLFQPRDHQRSLSPESIAVHGSSSTATELEGPLLG